MNKKTSPSSRKGVPSKMKGRKMPPRAQIVRLARIASLLKRNSCPTAEKLLKEYRDIELVEGKTIRAKYSHVVRAVRTANALGIDTVGITGADGGKLADLCTVCIRLPETETYKVQELTLPVYHALCAALEAHYFS